MLNQYPIPIGNWQHWQLATLSHFQSPPNGHSKGDLPRNMRDEPPCVFLSLNFKLQKNNFKQPARTGNNKG